ncbi:MAG: PadR family transcriptional regulator [Dehalococcoidia bacterium]|nr:PadR family transcriptional regulator [Dehalococcoidia bacterium]
MLEHPAPPFDPTPKSIGALKPLEYALLGLLSEQPSHGYVLQQAFSESADLGAVIRVEAPTLYAALKELAARGLIAGHEVKRGSRPARTVFELTADGSTALEEWLTAPVERLREIRLDFLLKLYFLRRRGADSARALVDAQVAACHRYLARLEAWTAELPLDSWVYLVAESRVVAARGTLEWLRSFRGRV